MGYSERDKLRIKEGICLDCKEKSVAPLNLRCHGCRVRLNRRARNKYRKQVGLQTCPVCEKGRVEADRKVCKKCQAQRDHQRWVNYWTKRGKLPATS